MKFMAIFLRNHAGFRAIRLAHSLSSSKSFTSCALAQMRVLLPMSSDTFSESKWVFGFPTEQVGSSDLLRALQVTSGNFRALSWPRAPSQRKKKTDTK